jgi:hypothetical protein
MALIIAAGLAATRLRQRAAPARSVSESGAFVE